MAENYDLIFGQGASSQYAWSDSDYQNGWKTVGSTPPTAEQFDALQRRSDTKAKDLNNRLSPLETTASKALARVTPAANMLPYFNSSNSATTTAISDFTKTLLDDKDAATARATLGTPSMTGANASGSWNINAATATKLATPRKINITGNATGAATFDGSGDASINVTVDESKHAAAADVVQKAIQPRGVFGHNSYIFYGTLTIPQKGDFFKLEVLGGLGYTAEVGQSLEGTLYFRTGNGNPAHYAAYSEYHRNGANYGANSLKFFVVKDSGTQYRIYSGLTNFTGTMQVIPYIGKDSSFDLALTTVSALPDGADEVEQQLLIYASTVNNYAPTKTGSGASGTWGINISGNAASATKATSATTAAACSGNSATATKLATPRTISLTGNASGSANFDGSGNVSISTTVNESKHAANADAAANADKLASESGSNYLSLDDTTEDSWSAIGSNPGSWLKSIRTNDSAPPYSIGGFSAAVAFGMNDTKGIITHAYYDPLVKFAGGRGSTAGWKFIIRGGSNNEVYDLNNFATKTGSGASGTWGINISGNAASADSATNVSGKIYYSSDSPSVATDKLFTVKQAQKGDDNAPNNGLVIQTCPSDANYNGKLYITDNGSDGVWIGGVAAGKEVDWTRLVENKGTWDISITGNAASATGADKLDGYHASDLLRTLGGNKAPVITDIFDRAGTIDMSTMSAADKATDKANINKASNMTQNLWNNSSGIRAYGGDTDMNGYSQGTLKLTQSYKNFDKILVVNSNDDANWIAYRMWDVWELAHAFANSYRFNLLGQGDIYWNLYGTAKHGTTTDYAVSTDTVWSCQKENSGIIAIYGIKF